MDKLKEALENLLFLIDQFVPADCFKNGVEHQGIDEGDVICGQLIDGARQVLFSYMTEIERENSPVFNKHGQ